MPPAARVTDMHLCPATTGAVPHVGGPILPIECSPDIIINGLPAAMVGTMAQCIGPPDTIAQGSATVFFNGRPASRMGDMTVHGGQIIIGSPNVIIGDVGMGGAGLPCGVQMSAAKSLGAAYSSADCKQSLGDDTPGPGPHLDWVKIKLTKSETGKDLAPEELHGQTTDGVQHKQAISAGQMFSRIPTGGCTFSFPKFYDGIQNWIPPGDD